MVMRYLLFVIHIFLFICLIIYRCPSSYFSISYYDDAKNQACDYSEGEWIGDFSNPLYNGRSCETIITKKHNCMLYGRPDREYLYWRWKPKGCNLPRFDPTRFLNLVKNKHVAFVGDSLARSQFESLLCMLSSITEPEHLIGEAERTLLRRWSFPSHNAIFSVFWAPYLVRALYLSKDVHFNTIFLDKISEIWASDVRSIDILVISFGHWYPGSTIYYENNSLIGCFGESVSKNCTPYSIYDAFEKSLATAFNGVIETRKGIQDKDLNVYFTTISPPHFEGSWNRIDTCSKTQPYGRDNITLDEMYDKMRRIQMDQVTEARKKIGEKYRLRVSIDVLNIWK